MDLILGEIRLFPYKAIPAGWFPCDGRSLRVREYQALFSILSDTYGGDGKLTFSLPDLRGVTPVGVRRSTPLKRGDRGGASTVTLTTPQLPAHTHSFLASSEPGTVGNVTGAVYAHVEKPTAVNIYGPPSNPPVPLEATTLTSVGGGNAHNNMQPYIALVYCIAVAQADYPKQSEPLEE